MDRFSSRSRSIAMVLAGLAVAAVPLSAKAETRTFAISWFTQAANSADGDCPAGLNPLAQDYYPRDLKAIGKSQEEIDKIMKGYLGGSSTPDTMEALVMRGRIDGKPVNAYTFPMAVPDPHLSTVKAHYAFGFNLDGRGAASPNSFEDPETHEQGVNNQYWRAMGCHINHRATPPDLPPYWSMTWSILRDSMPAWLVSVQGADLSKDGDVTISFNKALEHILRDVNGNVRADATFRVDPDPRWQNLLHGKMKDGVITVDSGNIRLAGDVYLVSQLDIHQTHLRMKLKPDGTMEAILGGYIPWRSVYQMYAGSGYSAEGMVSTDIPGIWHSLKELADADPDPKTGENMSISAAFRINAVPAFGMPVVDVPRTIQTSQAP